MSRPKAVLDLIARGPMVTAEVCHHPSSAAELFAKLDPSSALPPSRTVRFLVDTGAPHNILHQRILDELGIEPHDLQSIATPMGVKHDCPTCRVALRLQLDDGVLALKTTVVGMHAENLLTEAGYLGILGRQTLQWTRFVYDGGRGHFTIAHAPEG